MTNALNMKVGFIIGLRMVETNDLDVQVVESVLESDSSRRLGREV
jgi:hypothetical protein